MSHPHETPATDPSPIGHGGDHDSPMADAQMADAQMTLSVGSPSAGQTLVEVGGEVDMPTSPRLRSVLLDQLGPSAGRELVVLVLDAVTFLGTSGLAVLIEAREAAHTAGVELRLVCTERRVLRPLTIAGLVPLFDVHDTLEQALTPPETLRTTHDVHHTRRG